ncbi:MAG: acyltransferase [Lysobacter sp.]|nr:acyltransferase [Lysobacter sp.]
MDGSSALSRVVELDALRGLAALAVVAYHYTTHYGNLVGHVQPLPFGFAAGNYGVHLFFLISGFVIFMSLERTRTAMDFVVSRVSRLYPAYWAALMVSAAVIYTIGLPEQRLPLGDLLLDVTMVQQILGGEHLDGSYWTLQVELFFYAQMLFWFAVGQLKRVHWIIGAWLVLAVIYGQTAGHGVLFSDSTRELLILRHFPFFALGILFYRLRSKPGEHPLNITLIALTLVAIGLAGPPVLVLVAMVCCGIFALFVGGHLKWLCWAPFAFLGAISYSLYLLHQAIGFALIHLLEQSGVSTGVAMVLALGAALALASAITFLVERPAMNWIRAAWRQHRPPLART